MEMLRILDGHMRAAGYETIVASNGQSALSAATHRAPDLIVMNLVLPKLDGFELLRSLATMPGRPRTIALSGGGCQDDVTRAFQLGADDYVTTPFDAQELMARVARLLK
jgi:DNA-binding response OmpR family regulator